MKCTTKEGGNSLLSSAGTLTQWMQCSTHDNRSDDDWKQALIFNDFRKITCRSQFRIIFAPQSLYSAKSLLPLGPSVKAFFGLGWLSWLSWLRSIILRSSSFLCHPVPPLGVQTLRNALGTCASSPSGGSDWRGLDIFDPGYVVTAGCWPWSWHALSHLFMYMYLYCMYV